MQEAHWKRLGPGGGGAQYIPTVSPFDPDTVLVACDMTGSYITHDGGGHWELLNFKAWTDSFAFDPVNRGVVYAGATGLYRSKDNGDSWSLIFPDPAHVTGEVFEGDHAEHSYITADAPGNAWPGGKVKAIAVDPARRRCIMIAVNPGNHRITGFTPGNGSNVGFRPGNQAASDYNPEDLLILYSEDGGANWRQVLKATFGCGFASFVKICFNASSAADDREFIILTDKAIYSSSVGSRNASSIFMTAGTFVDATWGTDRKNGTPVFYILKASPGESSQFPALLYRSADSCRSFEPVAALPAQDMAEGQVRRFTRIAASAGDASVLYLSCCEPTSDNPNNTPSPFYFGIFKSMDFGDSWDWSLRIGERNPGNRSLGWVERDYATDWGGAPFNMGVSPSDPNVCYASDWGTSYRTVDGGRTWEELYCDVYQDGTFTSRGLDVTNVYGIHFDPFDKNHMAISCTDIGLFASANGGASWKHAEAGVPSQWANSCYWVAFDPQVKGRAWSAWSNCHDLPRPKMLANGKVDNCAGGVCKTEDGMSTWAISGSGIPGNCAVTHLVLDPSSPAGRRTLYAASFGRGVFKSADDGNTWTLMNNGIEEGNLNAWKLALPQADALYLLVARGLDNDRPVDGALYVSRNGAESWERVNLPPGVNFPNDICFDPSNPRRVYLACWPESTGEGEKHGGLHVSDDCGGSWSPAYDEAAHVYGVAVDPAESSTVYIATFEGELLRSCDGAGSWKHVKGFDFKWPKSPVTDPYGKGMLYITTYGSGIWHGSGNV